MSHITFIQSETAKPSMKVHMGYPLPAGKYTIRDTYSACKKRVHYGWWVCENHHLKTETTARVNSELPALLQTVFSKFSRAVSAAPPGRKPRSVINLALSLTVCAPLGRWRSAYIAIIPPLRPHLVI